MKLNKIIAGFNKTIYQLDALIERNYSVIDSNNSIIGELSVSNKVLNDEITRADKILKNVVELIGE
jgi:hypothetical protein